MPTITSILKWLLVVTAFTTSSTINRRRLQSIQVSLKDNAAPVHDRYIPSSKHIPGYGPLPPANLGISYGDCYIIYHLGNVLTSDVSNASYYQFQDPGHIKTPPKIFQVCKSRAFCRKDDDGPDHQSVPDLGDFFLWDPRGSNYTNGGSWVAGDVGGRTYPGYGPNNSTYLDFKGRGMGERKSIGSRAHSVLVVGVTSVNRTGTKTFHGVNVGKSDYLVSSKEEGRGLDFLFLGVPCPYGGEDGERL